MEQSNSRRKEEIAHWRQLLMQH